MMQLKSHATKKSNPKKEFSINGGKNAAVDNRPSAIGHDEAHGTCTISMYCSKAAEGTDDRKCHQVPRTYRLAVGVAQKPCDLCLTPVEGDAVGGGG